MGTVAHAVRGRAWESPTASGDLLQDVAGWYKKEQKNGEAIAAGTLVQNKLSLREMCAHAGQKTSRNFRE